MLMLKTEDNEATPLQAHDWKVGTTEKKQCEKFDFTEDYIEKSLES